MLGWPPGPPVTLKRVALKHDWMNAGFIQMHVRSLMTSVMPELTWIHTLDLDWERFMQEECQHNLNLASI